MTRSKLFAALFAISGTACAQGLDVIPPGLQPGDQYRILIVTDGARDALSSDIADYDAFVAADAAAVPALAGLATNWRALAGTPGLDARVHTETMAGLPGSDVPLFRADGVRIVDQTASLWSSAGSNGQLLLASPMVTASGLLKTDGRVWTGSKYDGSNNNSEQLGESQPGVGWPVRTNYQWCWGSWMFPSNQLPLFGISDVLTVPAIPSYPPGVEEGGAYRVMFVSDSQRTATSTNGGSYNSFVTADVAGTPLASLSTNWRAVVSMSGASARTRCNLDGAGVPIYLPNGQRFVDGYQDLWDNASPMSLLATPNITPNGTSVSGNVWTGTLRNGNASTLHCGSLIVERGNCAATNGGWIRTGGAGALGSARIYGISDVLTKRYAGSERPRLGGFNMTTPPTRYAFKTSVTTRPVLGGTWDPIVDHSEFAPASLIDVAVFGTSVIDVTVPDLGTILCNDLLADVLTALPGTPFALAIPDTITLLGAELCVQALSLDADGMHLANAIDIRVGEF